MNEVLDCLNSIWKILFIANMSDNPKHFGVCQLKFCKRQLLIDHIFCHYFKQIRPTLSNLFRFDKEESIIRLELFRELFNWNSSSIYSEGEIRLNKSKSLYVNWAAISAQFKERKFNWHSFFRSSKQSSGNRVLHPSMCLM